MSRPVTRADLRARIRERTDMQQSGASNQVSDTTLNRDINTSLGLWHSLLSSVLPERYELTQTVAANGSAAFDLHRPGEFKISTDDVRSGVGGPRRVLIGPEHPYIHGGLPMDAGGVGHGVADMFAWQLRAFLDQIAGIDEFGPLPGFGAGLHGLRRRQDRDADHRQDLPRRCADPRNDHAAIPGAAGGGSEHGAECGRLRPVDLRPRDPPQPDPDR